jgi:CheY-like chemotaxis protein
MLLKSSWFSAEILSGTFGARAKPMKRDFAILLAEDDENDAVLFSRTVAESARQSGIRIEVRAVGDGDEAIAYLGGEGKYGDRGAYPFPGLIVLDLKMPRLSGLDVLKWLMEHPEYRRVPKILMSGSSEERDIDAAYRLGVNTYFQKPGSLEEYRELIHIMVSYWAHTQRPVIYHPSAPPAEGL